MTIELVIGQQATAAQTVSQSIPDLNDIITALSDDLGVSGAGFQGQAATGLGEALTAWFQSASQLGPALEQYAAALSTVDNEHSRNEGAQVTTYTNLFGRLGAQ